MAVAVVYDVNGEYDCSKCDLARSINLQCSRILDAKHSGWEDVPNLVQLTQSWSKPDDPEYAEETCWRFQVRDESWQIVEDAKLLARYGLLFEGGGVADQPVWWWIRVQSVLNLISDLERTRAHAPESLESVVKQFQEQVQGGLVSRSRASS